ncbi:STAS domain-containing protein [Rugosimonospora acidiphila]
MSIDVSEEAASVIRVTVAGELTTVTVNGLRTAVAGAIGGRPRAVIVDLDRVTFLDSSGIGSLIAGRHLADAHALEYRVVNARDHVRWVLNVSGVWSYLAGDDPD